MEPQFIIGNGINADVRTKNFCDRINYMIMNIATYKGKILPSGRLLSYVPYVFKNKYIMVTFKDDDYNGFGYYVYISPNAIKKAVVDCVSR